MESNTSTTLFPSRRCKTLHLVRHAQGIHNVDGEKNHDAYMSPAFFDAHLTPLGWEQQESRFLILPKFTKFQWILNVMSRANVKWGVLRVILDSRYITVGVAPVENILLH
ncbi:phosphoglycerate mutase-like protein 1 isoform X1 [Cinnamomum micranthum f. kanehirae]|uniref:Phosphoglycerate mutase-like protein 1 isoform X1 n=1 Tax=Cinnamomum micranthum f. kanehirae TaxID=337451 RepID=A0A3S3MCU1_9MAGN|nr:phosphoglycerate mutase-like protein 1 isoform X1 [Cinnamomum micranthum f. kanehirae]